MMPAGGSMAGKKKAPATRAKPQAKPPAGASKASARARRGRASEDEPVRPELASRATRRVTIDVKTADPSLFAPLSEGERADALRTLLEDERLRGLAKLGRYRVISVEPLVVKPPDPLAGRRLARLVIYDYASDHAVDACVDLDHGAVCHVATSTAQPMLCREEEQEALAIAQRDTRVLSALGREDVPAGVMHYWSLRVMDFAYKRRSAAVLFAAPGQRPSLVAVVSLVDGNVVEIVPGERW
jgi:hypothetical protein